MNPILQYFNEKGRSFTHATNEEIRLEECPFCGDTKYHLYVNIVTGLGHCKKCAVNGSTGYNFNQIREKLGDQPIELPHGKSFQMPKEYKTVNTHVVSTYSATLLRNPKLLAYLEGRGLTRETITHFQLGQCEDTISIPYIQNGQVVNFNYRKNPFIDNDAPKYKTEKGCRSILFNIDSLLSYQEGEIVILTEGAFDAMRLWQEGFKYALSVPLGANHFSEQWVPYFEDVSKIVILFDTDHVGRQGAERVQKLFGDRAVIVRLPKGKDATEYYQLGGTTEELLRIFSDEKLQEQGDVRHLASYTSELLEKMRTGDNAGIPTGCPELDFFLGGLKPGHVTLLSGLPGAGKTAFSQNLAYHMAARLNIKVLFFSLEMTPLDIAKRFLTISSNIDRISGKGITQKEIEKPTEDDIEKARVELLEFQDWNLYLYDGESKLDVEKLREVIKKTVEEKNIQVVFIDHLHYFSGSSLNKSAEIGNLMRGIRSISLDLHIPIVLLCHINRSGRQQQKTGLYVPSLSDLKDCFTGDTEVMDKKTGRVLTLQEAYEEQRPVSLEVLEYSGKKGVVEGLYCYQTGEKDVFEITLKTGRTVKASAGSKLYTIEGWKKVSELKVGESISVSSLIPTDNTPLTYGEGLLTLIGLLLSQGNIDTPLQVATDDKNVVDFIEECTSWTHSPISVDVKRGNKDTCLQKKPGYISDLQGEMREMLSGENKYIPDVLKNLSHLETSALLRGLFQGEGTYMNNFLSYTTTSQKLAIDIELLLSKCGIHSEVVKKTKCQYCVEVRSGHNYFYDHIGFIGKKQENFLKQYAPFHFQKCAKTTFPKEVFQILEKKKGEQSWNSFGYSVLKNVNGERKCPQRKTLAKLANMHGDIDLWKLATMHIDFEEIVSITPLGKQMTYDFEVPIHHHFFLHNGILAHNSSGLEQDASEVVFICRDTDASNPHERSNVQIKVAKNRDGKVGATSIHFNEEGLYFSSYSKGIVNPIEGDDPPLPDDLPVAEISIDL